MTTTKYKFQPNDVFSKSLSPISNKRRNVPAMRIGKCSIYKRDGSNIRPRNTYGVGLNGYGYPLLWDNEWLNIDEALTYAVMINNRLETYNGSWEIPVLRAYLEPVKNVFAKHLQESRKIV